MAEEGDLWLLIPRPIRRLPADLAAVVAWVFLTAVAALAPVVRETPLRILFGLPLVLFLPGYAFIAALFPEAGTAPGDEAADDEQRGGRIRDRDREGIDGLERIALSFGSSIAVVPLIGLVLNFTPWGLRLRPVLLGVGGFTLLAVGVATVRRRELPPEERFSVPYRGWLAAARTELVEPETRADAALNVLLAASVVLAVASVGYAVAVPKQGESFTEFYVLARDDGELVADGYPTEFVRGESKPVVIGIGNQEHRSMRYTVVIELQQVQLGNRSTTVLEERELDRLRARLAHNETWMADYDVTPTLVGERLRLAFLLYSDDPPEEPTIDNAYRELHLWVNVSTAS